MAQHHPTLRAAARRRRRREGMTLIEIMIVVVIMAMIATAVGIAVMPQLEKARINDTRAAAQTIRSAVTLYMTDHHDCPSMEALVESRVIDRSKRTTDAWDQPFSIQCEGGEVYVVSSGPDGQMGTDDDVE